VILDSGDAHQQIDRLVEVRIARSQCDANREGLLLLQGVRQPGRARDGLPSVGITYDERQRVPWLLRLHDVGQRVLDGRSG
jgi:hypothetical protein